MTDELSFLYLYPLRLRDGDFTESQMDKGSLQSLKHRDPRLVELLVECERIKHYISYIW